MPDNTIASRASADFKRARFKAFFNDVWAALSGRPKTLLSYDEIREKLSIGGPIYRGVEVVDIKKISGSLNRYHEFDRAFLPKHDKTASRWQRVNRAFYDDISLPAVVLYKVGEVYFVVDGHHRVSVAREQGQLFIDAEVRECATKVSITADLRPEDLTVLGQKVEFLKRSQLDMLRPEANIKLNIPDGFMRMLEHIAVHRYFMGIDLKRDIPEDEAVMHWYDTVYLPIINVIQESDVLKNFPDKTEGDLYLWVLDRQHYLAEHEKHPLQAPDLAAREFIENKDDKPNRA
ncbi:MAG: hypothetical protein HN855_09145 [Anaerolineae bacterium]|jgi:hypothetical protein|nr:hypothetical protein [Anaerolineae bacterium]MBT7070034.1 hypothetical protein [Anaerolineae bacterium]MBT7325311.1 hypothetical protein [Anaerolineae bacterium]